MEAFLTCWNTLEMLKEVVGEGEWMAIIKLRTKESAEGLHKRLLRNFGGQRSDPAMD